MMGLPAKVIVDSVPLWFDPTKQYKMIVKNAYWCAIETPGSEYEQAKSEFHVFVDIVEDIP